MNVNEQLQDDAIRHQIGILRLRAGALRRIINVLEEADADLASQIKARLADLSSVDIDTISTSGTFSTERLKRLRASVQRLERVTRDLYDESFNEEMRGIASYEQEFWAERLNRALPKEAKLVVNTVAPSIVEAAAFARPLQGRLLRNIASEWGQQRRAQVNQAIRLGFINGETINQISARVGNALGVSRRNAERETRTAVTHVASFARRRFAERNSDLIKDEVWVSTLDGRTSSICASRDGRRINRDLRGARPPAHWNCRSTTMFVVKSWRELGFDIDELSPDTRASLNGQVPAELNFSQWFDRQGEDFQREWLGATKFGLFQSGNFKITDFIDRSGGFYTIPELRRREPEFFRNAA